MMHYILQENIFKEKHYDLLEQCLIKYDLPYTKVRLFPFVNKIVALSDIPDSGFNVDDLPEYVPPTNHVFCFGAIKLARIAQSKNWKPGSLMNDNHDFLVYKDYYKEELLNYDSFICKVSDSFEFETDKFIRPTKDTKSFTGKVYTKTEWIDSVTHNLHNFKSDIFNESTTIQVSSVKKIYQEIRCWVVNRKVVTASTYKVGSQVIYNKVIDSEPLLYAQKMVDLYQIADAFVIDICETELGWKIVELNCINCAGFYDADMYKLIESIENYFNI